MQASQIPLPDPASPTAQPPLASSGLSRPAIGAALCAIFSLFLAASTAWAQPKPEPPPAGEDAEPDAPPPDDDDGDEPPADQPPEQEEPEPPPPTKEKPAKKPEPPLVPVDEPEPKAAPPAKAKPAAEASKDGAEDVQPEASKEIAPASEVYAEDWFSLARPVLELHGYYRVRAEFMHNFALGRRDLVTLSQWPQPPDKHYIDTEGNLHDVSLCGDNPREPEVCDSNTQAGANMRFRLNPELHISDNVRIMAQIDLLDNIVLGSTPDGYGNEPAASGGYAVIPRGGYYPTSAFTSTQWAPVAGYNSTKDSIMVKRVWGEYSSPIGQLRFGRMPSHWGLGILANSGDGYDSDWQSTADRLMFMTGVKQWDLYFAAAWDFANEGPSSASLNEQNGQPYDLAQMDDVDQWVFVVVRRRNAELARKELAKGWPVFNGGAYVVYRSQLVAADGQGEGSGSAQLGANASEVTESYLRRGAEVVIPDLWFQFLYKTFRLEMEGVMIWGSIENTESTTTGSTNYFNPHDSTENGWDIRMFGFAMESEFRAIENRLKVQLGFGYASGDDDIDSLSPTGLGLQPQLTLDRTISTFRFHPNYRVDLILWRNIFTRVQGAYYFRPSVGYDFMRHPDGQRIGGEAALIWSRASEFVQTPGHARDLGVELNFKLYFQAKDGVLNDDLEKMGGFYTSLQYGVLFPLDGLGYLPGEVSAYADYQQTGDEELDTETAQTVRWYLGVLF